MAAPIITADRPTPPQPCTASHSPGCSFARSTKARNDVVTRQPMPAASTKSIASGSGTRLKSARGTAMRSAKAPQPENPTTNW